MGVYAYKFSGIQVGRQAELIISEHMLQSLHVSLAAVAKKGSRHGQELAQKPSQQRSPMSDQ